MFESSDRVGGKNMDIVFNKVAHGYMVLGPSYFKTFLPLAKVKIRCNKRSQSSNFAMCGVRGKHLAQILIFKL